MQRPTHPRSMYRAHLEPSQVLVGIYWRRHGWAAVVADAAVAGAGQGEEHRRPHDQAAGRSGWYAVPPAGQVPVRSVAAYFFQGRSIRNGESTRTGAGRKLIM